MLSKRLNECLKYISGNKLADIGADHGYACIEAVRRGLVSYAYACDINQGPLAQAQANIKRSKLSDKIETILKDGMKGLPEGIDCILIAGMGGNLIKNILSNGNHHDIERLVLAPNNDSKEVRGWLINNGYMIIEESIIKEKKHFYEIIAAVKGNQNLSLEEICFGPVLIANQSPVFIEKQKYLINVLEAIDLNQVNNDEEIINKIALLKKTIQEQ